MGKMAARFVRWSLAMICVASLLACGAEDEPDDSEPGADPGLGDASLELTASRPTVPSSGNEQVTLTATVKDEQSVVQEGIQVSFQADSGQLQVDNSMTDAAGRASAVLSSGTDARERTITVSAQTLGGEADDEIKLQVSDTTLELSGPDTIQSGSAGTFVAVLRDSDDQGIAGVDLSASTASGSGVTPVDEDGNELTESNTDSQGRVRFEVDAATSTTDDTLTVEGFGESATRNFNIRLEKLTFLEPALQSGGQAPTLAVDTSHEVEVELREGMDLVGGETIDFTISRGGFTGSSSAVTGTSGSDRGRASVDVQSATAGPATITAEGGGVTSTRTVRFVATNPSTVTLTSESPEIPPNGETTIEALVEDDNGNPVAGATVNFNIVADPSQGTLSENSADTNANGIARTVFTAGPNISGQDGVEITAFVAGEGLSDKSRFTVSGTALSVSIGTGNSIQTPSETEYSQPWAVVVTNSTGAPAADREVNISVEPLDFIKGEWVIGGDFWVAQAAVECTNEDKNFNNSLDPGEDLDNDGKLEPDVPVVSEGTVTTGQDGRGSFDLIYPESEAAWVRVRLKASVKNSAGTAFTDSSQLVLVALADDINSTDTAPPGGTRASPYGTSGDCSDPS